MTKDRKGSSASRVTSASASSLKSKKKKKNENTKTETETETNDIQQSPEGNADAKSIPESDTGKIVADNTAIESKPEEADDYNEPSLTHIIVKHYDGDIAANGSYDGNGEAHFIGGNIYKGSFYHGVMQGKGIYIWRDGSTYEGDFNNNKITGFGLYKWIDDTTYEGEVLNGKRHGVGTFKSPKQGISYSGQWYLGKRHGRGIMHYSEQSWYEGDWVNNARHGYGVRRYRTGNVYEGYWTNDQRHGVGTMRWLTTNEAYHGDWENGVQHGRGTHTWYLQRVPGSQYPLRNEYVGDFINGLRHGRGKFFYASGSVYDGEWENSKKSGWGKFIFKNGRVFEGQFENDHMVDYPTFDGSGTASPDPLQIRTRTPVAWEQEERDLCSDVADPGQAQGAGLSLDIDVLLENFNEDDRSEELDQVTHLLVRNITIMRRIYAFYSALGHDKILDNTFVMTRFQFWRFLKDSRIHHHNYTLWAIDKAIAQCNMGEDIHNPLEKVLIREFLSNIVIIAYKLYKENTKRDGKSDGSIPKNFHDSNKKSPVLAHCLQQLLDDNITNNACKVGGYFMYEPRYAIVALSYMEKCLQIYRSLCFTKRSEAENMGSITMREFMFFLRDLKLVGKNLTAQVILVVLSSDHPAVHQDGTTNLQMKMTFLEFFEALVGCAVKYATNNEIQSEEVIPDEEKNIASRPVSAISQAESQRSVKHTSSSYMHSQHTDHENQSVINQEEGMPKTDDKQFGQDEQGTGSKQSIIRSQGMGSKPAGGFLQTLSQLSVRDDNTTIGDDGASHYQESIDQNIQDENADEHNFRVWREKLGVFFTKLLFPAWDLMENLKSVIEKNRVEEHEKARLQALQKEAQRRLQSFREKEEKEEASPRHVEEDENADEACSQVASVSQESTALPEPIRSNSSIKGKGKSGKKRK